MLKQFWDFINRGNVMDLAVAVIIGAAFSTIVSSFVEDIVTPALLNPAMQAAGVDQLANLAWRGIAYGSFLAAVLNFLVVAFVLFLLVRAVNEARRRLIRGDEHEADVPPPEDVALLREIRDLLKQNAGNV